MSMREEFIVMLTENHAQLIRFVQRKQMTSDEAALLAYDHAEALRDLIKSRDRAATMATLRALDDAIPVGMAKPTDMESNLHEPWPPPGRQVDTSGMDVRPEPTAKAVELQQWPRPTCEAESKLPAELERLFALQRTLDSDPYLFGEYAESQDPIESVLIVRARKPLEKDPSEDAPKSR